jgi:hydrogenase nickel incorporation protein HypA/HybF
MEKKVILKGDFLLLDTTPKRITLRVDMHELSLTQNILDLALRNAGDKRILRVNLRVGQFSDEREESIRFYWNDLVKDTLAQDADLHFQHVSAQMKCLECGMIFDPKEETSMCPQCFNHRLKLLSGDDVRLESIDVE